MDGDGPFTMRDAQTALKNGDVIIYDRAVATKLEDLDADIASVKQQIAQLEQLKASLVAERRQTYDSYLESIKQSAPSSSNGKASRKLGVDYTASDFDWSASLKVTARKVFGIQEFRTCQEAVCNSAMDSRDAVVVMPTGGGKSLCYQLPAIMNHGITLVVSPLISLMTDQVLHLREVGIECELLCAANSKEDNNDIHRRIRTGQDAASSSSAAKDGIKLLYVTPERIAKAKTTLSALQKAYEQGRLSRIVIDEAHCCSQMGHDYRPDYKKLSILRKLFPDVPIMCLTATCGPKVLREVIRIIDLKDTTEPDNAAPKRTVYFTAPLFRPNLRYKVMQRPQNAQASYKAIADYILERHAGKSGIVYCLSKKDTQVMADSLRDISGGRIKTGVYHADLEDAQKHQVHIQWRAGKVSVVCATIAFGMGIDKGDVRFVIHACISKSLDGYYQETGRAGRDGQESDCVLMYRPQDCTRVSSLVAGEPTGQEKLHAMLEYAQSPKCRKVLFGDYFADMFGSHDACGICDNCVTNVESTDVTYEAWKLVRIVSDIHDHGGRVTLTALADLARGLGGGKYSIEGGGKRKGRAATSSAAGVLDLQQLCEGKVTLSKDNCERLVVELLLRRYLDDEYNMTAYSVNVYVQPGRQALRLSRLSADQAKTASYIKLLLLGAAAPTPRVPKKRKAPIESETDSGANLLSMAHHGDDEDADDDDDDDVYFASDLPRRQYESGSTSETAIEID